MSTALQSILLRILHWLFMGLVAFLCLFGRPASAQSVSLSGVVRSATDQTPLAGVSVIIKGTTTGTSTAADGSYKLTVNGPRAVLAFSYIGFVRMEMIVGNRTVIDVALAEDAQQLSEFVVTALGVKKDVRNVGVSIQNVDGASVIKAREPNPINSLVGKVAGLNIATSAELLRRPIIQLRGNTDVLFVVDGVPINSDTWNISPDDIDTYSVLKGASASALYGFRGKNGAILITTKRGSKDKRGFQVDVNTSQMVENGFLAIPKVQDLHGPGDHGVYEFVDGKGNGKNDGDYDIWGPPLDGRLLPQYDSPVDPTTGKRIPTPWIPRGKDNLTRFLQAGILSTNNIAVSSTGDKYDLRVSLSYTYLRGIVPNSQLNSTNFKVTTGYNFTDQLQFEGDMQLNRQYTPNYPDVNYGPNPLIHNMVIWGGADWNVDDMKNYWQPGKEGVQQIYAEYQRYNNPWFVSKEWQRGHYKTDIIGQTSLRYRIADGLEATLRTQLSAYNLLRTEKFPYSATVYGREEGRGDYREDRRNLFDSNTDLLIRYNHKIGSQFNVSAIGGGNLRVFNYNSNYATTNYLNVPGVCNFANSTNPGYFTNYTADMRVNSAYYSADVTFRDWLTISTTGRVDKLSTLPKGNNTFFYPSVALSSVFSDLFKLPTVISFLKLRASYANVKDALTASAIGSTPGASFPLGYGDNYALSYDGPTYQNSAVYSTPLVYNNQPGAYFTNTLNNTDIKPNSTSQAEIGLDLRLLRNRLAVDVAYYVSNDGPRIFQLPLSQTTGYSSVLVNGINTRKKGLEISVTGKALQLPNGLSWDVVANYAIFQERYTDIYPGVNTLNTFFKVGDWTDKYYSQTFVRTPEGQLVNDAGGRPIINPVAQYLGNINPDFT